jgi:hypothetical protein
MPPFPHMTPSWPFDELQEQSLNRYWIFNKDRTKNVYLMIIYIYIQENMVS